MNEIMESLIKRKSVREFEVKPITKEIKDQILAAALQAPSAGCQLLYTIIDAADQSLKDKLAVVCDNQPFIAKAPMVLIFLADCRRWHDTYEYANCDARKPNEADLMLAYADACIAAQNTVVAAQSFGIGSCYIGDIVESKEAVCELLTLDEYVFPAAMLVYGYPTQKQLERTKPIRVDQKYIVFENQYRRLTKEEHVEMFTKQAKERDSKNFDFFSYIKAFCKRKYMSDFAYEMGRSVKLYMENFKN